MVRRTQKNQIVEAIPLDDRKMGAGQKSSLSSQRQGVVAGGVEIEPVFPEL